MRADRLLAAVLILQARGRVTAAELAEELEVSVRTARRDLESLSMAGVPVYPQRGRDGGWQLIGGYRTDLSGLTADEARALFLVAGPSAKGTPEVRAALRKLVRALPEPLRAGAEAASAAVMVDPTGWGDGRQAPVPPFLDPLREAVISRRRVDLAYASPRRPPSVRTVDPFGLVAKRGTWYMVAGTENGLRTFRVDRVTSAIVRDDAVVLPDDFDLAQAWSGMLEEVEARRETPVTVRVEVDAEALVHLRRHYGSRLQLLTEVTAAVVTEPVGPGRCRVDIGFPSDTAAASDLAAWPDHLEVLGPADVRRHLAAIGATLVARYGADGEGRSGGST